MRRIKIYRLFSPDYCFFVAFPPNFYTEDDKIIRRSLLRTMLPSLRPLLSLLTHFSRMVNRVSSLISQVPVYFYSRQQRKGMSNADNTHTIDVQRRRPSSKQCFTPLTLTRWAFLTWFSHLCAPPPLGRGRREEVGNSIKMMNNARLVIYSHVSMNSSKPFTPVIGLPAPLVSV